VREHIRPGNVHIPVTGLVCLENTHNRHGGTCCTPERSKRWPPPLIARASPSTWMARGSSMPRSRLDGPPSISRARWIP
jgi:hypothetical protein